MFPEIELPENAVPWETTLSDGRRFFLDEFTNFVVRRVVAAVEAAGILDCSRKNIDDLTCWDKLYTTKTSGKTTLYLKKED